MLMANGCCPQVISRKGRAWVISEEHEPRREMDQRKEGDMERKSAT